MDKLLRKSQKKSKQNKTSKSSDKKSTDSVPEKKKKVEGKSSKDRKQIKAGQIQLVHDEEDTGHGQEIGEAHKTAEQDLKLTLKSENRGIASTASNASKDVNEEPVSGVSVVSSSAAQVKTKTHTELVSGFGDSKVEHTDIPSITDSVSEVNVVSTATSQLAEPSTSEFNRRHTIGVGLSLQEPIDFQVQVNDRQVKRQFSMDDTDIMHDQLSLTSEFTRGSKYRSSLPVVRPVVNMSKARPLGLIYLQYLNQTKRAWMPNEVTGIDTIRALFVRAFPKHLSMHMLTQSDKRIYIRDPLTEIYYELEDVRDIKDRCVVRLLSEKAAASTLNQSSTTSSRPVTSYYSEPEYDGSTNMRQHRHTSVTTTTVKQEQAFPTPTPTTPQKQYSSPVYMYKKRESNDLSKVDQSQPRPTSAMVTATLPTRTPQLYTDSVDTVTMSMKSATFPASSRIIDADRTEEPLEKKQVFSPVRQVAVSPAKPKTTPGHVFATSNSSHRPLSAPSPLRSSTPQKIEYTTAHGITPTNPEYLLRSMPHLNDGSISDSEMIRVHQQSLSGRSTPAMSDSDAGFRMSVMEKQIANLADLVHTALVTRPRRPSVDNSSCSSHEDLVNLSEEILRTTKRNSLALSESSKSARSDESSTTPHAYSPVRNLEILYTAQAMKKTCKHLREDLKQIRRLHLQQTQQSRDLLREAFQSLQFVLQSNPSINQHPIRAHRSKLHQDFLHYVQQNEKIERNLKDLEVKVEGMRDNVINRQCQVDVESVENLAQLLGNVSKMLAEQKVSFPILRDNMKRVMDGEMEVVVQEERFVKEEPIRMDSALKRCKKLTGTLFTLKRLSSVQEYQPMTILASPNGQEYQAKPSPTGQKYHTVPTPSRHDNRTPATPTAPQYHTSSVYHTVRTSAFENCVKPNHGDGIEKSQSSATDHSSKVFTTASSKSERTASVQAVDVSRQSIRHFMTPLELHKFEKSLQMGQARLHQTNNAERINKRHREHLYNMYKQEGHHTMIQAKSSKVPPPPPPRKQFSIKQYSPSIQSSGASSLVTRHISGVQATSPSMKTVTPGVDNKRGATQQSTHGKTVDIQTTSASTGPQRGSSSTSRITTTVIGPVAETVRRDHGSTPEKTSKKTVIGPSKATIGVIKLSPAQHQQQPLQEKLTQQQTITKTIVTKEIGEKKASENVDKVKDKTHESATPSGNYFVSKTTVMTSPPPKPPRLTSTGSDTSSSITAEQTSKKVPPPVPQRNSSILSTDQIIPHSYQTQRQTSSDITVQGQTDVSQQKVVKTYMVLQEASPIQTGTALTSQKRQSKELEELTAAIAELETVTQQTQEEAQRIAGEIKKAQQSPSDESKETKTIRLIKYQV